MERQTSQNLEFSQNLSIKKDECLDIRRSRNPYKLKRASCDSGGDNSTNIDITRCTSSKNSSYQKLSLVNNVSEEDECQTEHSLKSGMGESSTSVVSKKSYSSNIPIKRISKSGSKLNTELNKYKRELKEYNNTTKDLEEKYLKINYELNQMQQKHDRFVAHRKTTAPTPNQTDSYTDSSSNSGSSSTRSEYSLKRKNTHVFHRRSSFVQMLPASSKSSKTRPLNSQFDQIENQENCIPRNSSSKKHIREQTPFPGAVAEMALRLSNSSHPRRSSRRDSENDSSPCQSRTPNSDLKDIYKVLKNVLDTSQKQLHSGSKSNINVKAMHTTIMSLQKEQTQYRNIIQQQQNCLHDYHSRCIKAQQIMQVQQNEINKLNSNNQQLESEITAGIDKLRLKIDTKIRDVSQLPQKMREEQIKFEKVSKENSILGERLLALTNEATQLKLKMEELGRRKSSTITRLKTTERDLKIFKNYNTALKHEKRKLTEEMQKLREQLDNVQNTNKRSLSRQREQNEKVRRDLQKRVFELELKLSRSQNSTSGLLQERDNLIAELQTQLNTLVHNFEVSQKHIRVLRRHIYSMSNSSVTVNTNMRSSPT